MEDNKTDIYNFIHHNLSKDPVKILLSHKQFQYDFDLNFAVTQIICRKKYAEKLKNFLSYPQFLFPDSISAEQSSHRAVAQFHASLIQSSQTILDMTAGLGIDAMTFATKDAQITAIELNPQKANLLIHNTKTIGLSNLKVINADSIEYLKKSNDHYDLIFIDPSRRDSSNNRVYSLNDSAPDVISNQDLLLSHADRIFIKASPLLDIHQLLKSLRNITSIKAIGVKGECKEILIEMIADVRVNEGSKVLLEAINLDSEGNVISKFSEDIEPSTNTFIQYAGLNDIHNGIYILEPSAMIMKLAPWSSLCRCYKAKKLDKSSNIFITSEFPSDFPGRVTIFDRFLSKQDRKTLSGFPASVISKNHPLSSEDLRKKLNVKEGDEHFIYATKTNDKPVIFLSHKP